MKPILPLTLAIIAVGCDTYAYLGNNVHTADGGATSTGGAGGAGGGECTPKATASCYTGPAGTQGKGMCKAGTKTCMADRSYGPCMGEVTPKPEDCSTPEDENCDGNPCNGVPLWSERFGDPENQCGFGIATDASRNVVVTGYMYGSTSFGNIALTSAGAGDIFVAKFDASGAVLWAKRFGDASDQEGLSVAVDGKGDIIITGDCAGSVDFGSGASTGMGSANVFLAKFDASGTPLWSKQFGNVGSQSSAGVAVDTMGGITITGWFNGGIDFGGAPLINAGGIDTFLAKFDASGNHLWSKRFGGKGDEYSFGLAVDGAGSSIITGRFDSSVDFGLGALTSAGDSDVFVAKFDGSGNALWSKGFGDSDSQIGIAVAVDSANNVLVTGEFSGAINFGGNDLVSLGGYDIFVAKLNASGGHVWSKRFGLSSDQAGQSIAADGDNNVLLTGSFFGTVDFGGNVLTSAGASDVFLAKFDASGSHVWSKRFGDVSNKQIGEGVAADADGNGLLTGCITGTADFGYGPLTSAGGSDLFVAKFGP